MDSDTLRELKNLCQELPTTRFWGLLGTIAIVAIAVAVIFAYLK